MTTIIAGRFVEQTEAAAVIEHLVRSGFERDQMTSFFVNPAGQHDQYPIGGDEDASAGAKKSGTGAAAGAAGGTGVGIAVGLATAPLLGPGAVLAGAAAGAYVGSLVGALDATKPDDESGGVSSPTPTIAATRRAGMLVAVAAPASVEELTAISVMRNEGAQEIERSEGTIERGDWTDFDPLSVPKFVDQAAPLPKSTAPVHP